MNPFNNAYFHRRCTVIGALTIALLSTLTAGCSPKQVTPPPVPVSAAPPTVPPSASAADQKQMAVEFAINQARQQQPGPPRKPQ